MCYSFMVKQPPEWINEVVSDMYLKSDSIKIVPSVQVKEEYLNKKISVKEFRYSIIEALKPPSSGVIFWSWETLGTNKDKLSIVKNILSK